VIIKMATVACSAVLIGLAPAGSLDSGVAHAAGVVSGHVSVGPGKPLSCSPQHGRTLEWLGGPVSTFPFVAVVYWGSWWHHHGKSVMSEINGLYRDLGSTKWAATVTQYCAFGLHAPNGDILAATFIDNSDPPRSPTEKQLSAVAVKYYSNPSIDVLGAVAIVTPPGTAPAFDTEDGDCGHHSWATKNSRPDGAWIDIPYGFILSTHGCGWQLKQGAAGALSVVAAHEWAETMTDPLVNSPKGPGEGSAWASGGGKEVADLCEPGVRFHFFHKNTFILHLKTGSFLMQDLWSNAIGKVGKCVEGS
jgi:hypothetical protein